MYLIWSGFTVLERNPHQTHAVPLSFPTLRAFYFRSMPRAHKSMCAALSHSLLLFLRLHLRLVRVWIWKIPITVNGFINVPFLVRSVQYKSIENHNSKSPSNICEVSAIGHRVRSTNIGLNECENVNKRATAASQPAVAATAVNKIGI